VLDRHGKPCPQQVRGHPGNSATHSRGALLPETMGWMAASVPDGKLEGYLLNFLMVLPSESWMHLEERGERSWALLPYCFYIKVSEGKGTRRGLQRIFKVCRNTNRKVGLYGRRYRFFRL